MMCILKRKVGLFILTFCFILSMCCMFSCLVNAEGNELEIKDIKMTITPYGNGNMYDLTVNTVVPFTVAGEQNLEQKEELVRENLIINGKTIAEIDAFNERYGGGVVQIHRFEMIKIYIFDDFGSLPCGEHETNSACDCEDKRPVLKNDNSDIIEFKAGFTTGGFGAISTDSVWGLKYGLWWKDGVAGDGQWKPAVDGESNIAPTYDMSRSPSLPFFAQRLTNGSAVYGQKINLDKGFNLKISPLMTSCFSIDLRNADKKGVRITYSTDESWLATNVKVEYFYESADTASYTQNLNLGGRWHWEVIPTAPLQPTPEWTEHTVQIRKDAEGRMRVYVNHVLCDLLEKDSPFYQLKFTEMSLVASCSNDVGGQGVWLSNVSYGMEDPALNVVSVEEVNFSDPQFQVSFVVNFDQPLGQQKVNLENDDYFIQKYVEINRFSVAELNAATPGSVVIHRIGAMSTKLYFYISNTAKIPNTDENLIQQGETIKLEFSKGFAINNGKVLRETIIAQYEQDTFIVTVNHSMQKTEAKAATCTEEGNIEYWTCTECGKLFKDSEGNQEIEQADTVIPFVGHSMQKTEAKAATCTEEGNIEYWTCTECGKLFKDSEGNQEIEQADTVIPFVGHSMQKTEAKAATCTEEGNIEYWTCTECGKLFKDSEGNQEIEQADTVIPFVGHSMQKTEAKAATCTEEGNIEYWTCTECGKLFKDSEGNQEIEQADTVIPFVGHSMQKTEAKAATCTEEGNIEYWTCTECGKLFKDSEGNQEIEQADTVIPFVGHSMQKTEAKAATCTEEGNIEYWTCTECGKLFKDSEGNQEIEQADTVIPFVGHSMQKTEAKAATCTEEGNIEYWTCTECGKLFKDSEGNQEIEQADTVIVSKGHNFVDGSCTACGVKETTTEKSGCASVAFYDFICFSLIFIVLSLIIISKRKQKENSK